MRWLVLVAAIILNATANILIKTAVANSKAENVVALVKDKSFILPALAGICCFVLALASFNYVLSRTNLSVAYPILSSGCFLVIGLVSWSFFKESITPSQGLEFTLIIAGIWLGQRY